MSGSKHTLRDRALSATVAQQIVSADKYAFKNAAKSFTSRQLDVAILVMSRQTAKEIGKRLNISNRTAEYHIECLKDKLACENKTQLVERLLKVIQQTLHEILG